MTKVKFSAYVLLFCSLLFLNLKGSIAQNDGPGRLQLTTGKSNHAILPQSDLFSFKADIPITSSVLISTKLGMGNYYFDNPNVSGSSFNSSLGFIFNLSNPDSKSVFIYPQIILTILEFSDIGGFKSGSTEYDTFLGRLLKTYFGFTLKSPKILSFRPKIKTYLGVTLFEDKQLKLSKSFKASGANKNFSWKVFSIKNEFILSFSKVFITIEYERNIHKKDEPKVYSQEINAGFGFWFN